jgi:O-antigen/teichoic acid export membrane protein
MPLLPGHHLVAVPVLPVQQILRGLLQAEQGATPGACPAIVRVFDATRNEHA